MRDVSCIGLLHRLPLPDYEEQILTQRRLQSVLQRTQACLTSPALRQPAVKAGGRATAAPYRDKASNAFELCERVIAGHKR